jgi:hypothetical protein
MNHDLHSVIDEDRLVYVKSVRTEILPKDVREQVGNLAEIYAVHRADGEPVAYVKDRKLAFILARQNDLAPVTVQ